MNLHEAQSLTDRTMKIILSCKTYSQLKAAQRYVAFVYRSFMDSFELRQIMRFVCTIEETLGFALCQVNRNSKSIKIGE